MGKCSLGLPSLNKDFIIIIIIIIIYNPMPALGNFFFGMARP